MPRPPSSPSTREAAAASARTTHAHPEAVAATVVLAEAIHLLAHRHADGARPSLVTRCAASVPPDQAALRAKLRDVEALLEREPEREEVVTILGHAPLAFESVPTALYAFLAHSESFEAAVRYALSLGGDTDTIAAMVGALAGAHHGAGAIPLRWLARLEDGGRGRGYALQLADALAHYG